LHAFTSCGFDSVSWAFLFLSCNAVASVTNKDLYRLPLADPDFERVLRLKFKIKKKLKMADIGAILKIGFSAIYK